MYLCIQKYRDTLASYHRITVSSIVTDVLYSVQTRQETYFTWMLWIKCDANCTSAINTIVFGHVITYVLIYSVYRICFAVMIFRNHWIINHVGPVLKIYFVPQVTHVNKTFLFHVVPEATRGESQTKLIYWAFPTCDTYTMWYQWGP